MRAAPDEAPAPATVLAEAARLSSRRRHAPAADSRLRAPALLFFESLYAVRAARSATAPPSASRPIRPMSGSSLAVFGRLPEVPTGCAVSGDALGAGTVVGA